MPRQHFAGAALIALLLCGANTAQSAGPMILRSVKDTMLDADRPNNNMGAANYAAKVASTYARSYCRIMLVEFDLSKVASTNIAQATFRIHCPPSGWDHSVDANFLFFGMLQPWTEGTGTDTTGSETLDGASWTSRDGTNAWNGGSIVSRGGTRPSGNFDETPFATQSHTTYEEWLNKWIDVDATALVRDWLTGKRPNNGIAVCALGLTTNSAYTMFATREFDRDGYAPHQVAPKLVIRFPPEP